MSNNEMRATVRWVPLGACEVIFRDAQRDRLSERTIKEIIDDFDPLAIGIPFVARANGSGRYHIIDGAHRITALKRMGRPDDELIEVQVCRVRDVAEAADLFDRRNTFRAPSAVDRFIARVTARRVNESAAYELVRSMGFSIGGFAGPSVVSAVTALMRAYNHHGEDALRAALAAISATWKADMDRTRGEIIEAWTRLFGLYGEVVNPKRLADRIGKKYTAGNLIAAARASGQMFGGTVTDNVVRATVAQYNTGLRTNARIELD